MGDRTAIEWAANADGTPGASWNPIVGCSHASPGCRNCYAQVEAARQERIAAAAGRTTPYAGTTQLTKVGPVFTGKVAFAEAQLRRPLARRKPTTWFVNSMGDLGAEGVEDAWLDQVWAVMALCPQHTFIVLTKRPERLRAYLSAGEVVRRIYSVANGLRYSAAPSAGRRPRTFQRWMAASARDTAWLTAGGCAAEMFARNEPGRAYPSWVRWPLANVWLGVTAEDQERADQRIPVLLDTPAAVRFVSYEPAIGPLDLTHVREVDGCSYHTLRGSSGPLPWQVPGLPRLDWVICGGESGRGEHVRPMHPDWARQVRDDCAAAGVPFFFKQWGEWTPGENAAGVRGTLPAAWLRDDGWEARPVLESEGEALAAFDDEPHVYRIGKRRAGRLLDGELHNARPPLAASTEGGVDAASPAPGPAPSAPSSPAPPALGGASSSPEPSR